MHQQHQNRCAVESCIALALAVCVSVCVHRYRVDYTRDLNGATMMCTICNFVTFSTVRIFMEHCYPITSVSVACWHSVEYNEKLRCGGDCEWVRTASWIWSGCVRGGCCRCCQITWNVRRPSAVTPFYETQEKNGFVNAKKREEENLAVQLTWVVCGECCRCLWVVGTALTVWLLHELPGECRVHIHNYVALDFSNAIFLRLIDSPFATDALSLKLLYKRRTSGGSIKKGLDCSEIPTETTGLELQMGHNSITATQVTLTTTMAMVVVMAR